MIESVNQHAPYPAYYRAARIMTEQFMKPQPRRENTVVLLGDHGGPNGRDAKEVRALLRRFGLYVHCQFSPHASLEEMQRTPSSALGVLLGGTPQSYFWLRRLGLELQQKFCVPLFDCDYPVGWQGTQKWLRKLGEFLMRGPQALQAEKEQKQILDRQFEPLRRQLQGSRVHLCIASPLLAFQPAWVMNFFRETGVVPEKIVIANWLAPRQRKELRHELEKYTDAAVLEENLRKPGLQTADLLITTDELGGCRKRNFVLPVTPPVGVGGFIELTQRMAWKLIRCSRRAGGTGQAEKNGKMESGEF